MDAAVYLDIKEAFSSVLHKRLLWKLKHIGDGLQGKLLEWMQDYWKDKEMRTVIREATSSWRKVTSGVCIAGVSPPSTHHVSAGMYSM